MYRFPTFISSSNHFTETRTGRIDREGSRYEPELWTLLRQSDRQQ